MGKVFKAVGIGILLIGLAVATGGSGLTLFGATISQGAIIAAGITATLSGLATLAFAPKMPRAQISRLNVTMEPAASRKSVFGTTAMALDLRYHESSGSDQEYIDYIIAVAAHKVTSIDEIWFEDKKAWSASGGVESTYTGYLTVDTITEGATGSYITINSGSKWGPDTTLTGCAYVHIRIKRTGNTKKAESPVVQGLPSRVTIKGNGALLYDPRKDSTVTGGSGSHRADDQSTWGSYTDPDDCDNPALQLLWWMLGWKINDVLSVGCGVPPERIDLESFITAANTCDESVTLSIGGTQKRYRSSGVCADTDDRMDIINMFLTSMNGTLRDNDGKLTVTVMKNDLANYVLTFSDDDILNEFEWNQTRGLNDSYNVARGRYVDPSDNSLYQLVDYPEVRMTSPDGIERVMTVDLAYVEDGRRAQRLAKQVLQRNQYRGTFSATFSAKALGCQVGDVVRLTFGTLGWTNKLFRVISQQIDFSGRVPLVLIEENAAIYAWDAEDSAPVTPIAPTVYDPLNNPFILAIGDAEALADGKITSFYQTSAPTAEGIGDIWFDTNDGNKLYRWDGSSWVVSQDTAISTAIADAADAQATADGKVQTFYQSSAPTAEALGDLWYDTDDATLYRWNGTNWSSAVSDITANAVPSLDGVSPITFYADYLGALTSGQLPYTFNVVRRKGGTDVSSSTTWSIVSQDGITGTTVTVSSTGVVTIPTSSTIASNATIVVRSVKDGTTLDASVGVTKINAAPPSTGSGGGSTASDSTFNSISTTSFVDISDVMVVTTGSSGQIQFSAPLTITTAADAEIASSDTNVEMKWQYRTSGSGSYTDVASAVNSSPDLSVTYVAELDKYSKSNGSITCSPVLTGLSTSANYDVKLLAKRSTTSTAKTFTFIGTASAVGS